MISDPQYRGLKSFSSRHLYSKQGYKVISMDAKSVDLKVLSGMAVIKTWEKIFELGLDNHFEILRVGNPAFFKKLFKDHGGIKISGIKELVELKDQNKFLLVTIGGEISLSKKEFEVLSRGRDTVKQTNLGIPYLLGSKELAKKILDATGEPLWPAAAKEMQENYYANFPEIRVHHDLFALRLFRSGYFHPSYEGKHFGMKFHSNTWFSLNSHRLKSDQNYELILKYRGHHFYVSLDSWLQDESLFDGAVSIGLKPFFNSLPLFFKRVNFIKQLSSTIFAIKIKRRKSKHRRNEDMIGEESDFEIDSIDRTYLIRREISDFDNELNEIERDLKDELTCGSLLKVSSNHIKYYCDTIPATQNYFKQFKDLFNEARKIFPTYIQGVSAVCVGRVLTNIRLELEKRQMKSYIFLSVHDSIDIMAHESEVEEVNEIIRNERVLETFIPVTWKYDEPSGHWN